MTGTTTSNIDELIQLINASESILRYNSDIRNEINQNGGTVLYSYNNIIIASEISEELYNQLQISPNIDYIEDLPLKKYGEVDLNLIDQLDISTLSTYNINGGTDGILNGSIIVNTGITYTGTTSGIDGLSGKSRKTNFQNIQNNISSGVTLTSTPPVITNEILSISALTNSWFNYELLASGTAPLTFEIIKPNNYQGNLFIKNGTTLSGMTSDEGIYNIVLKVSNNYGSYSTNLTLNILNPIKITNTNLEVYSKIGTLFSYTIESTGTPPKTYSVTGLPAELTLINNVISGVFLSAVTYNLTITVSNAASSDSKILKIESGEVPVITSLGQASCYQYYNFTYTVTSSPVSGVTYNIIGILPEGLQFGVDTISGIPIYDGVYYLKIKATSPYGTSTKDLTITTYSI